MSNESMNKFIDLILGYVMRTGGGRKGNNHKNEIN
jgi:hypothetical protein